jgi:hypothetical protein
MESDEGERWKLFHSEGRIDIFMPEEDACELEKRARKAKLTVENFLRRSLGLSDWPED